VLHGQESGAALRLSPNGASNRFPSTEKIAPEVRSQNSELNALRESLFLDRPILTPEF
jgi:hypothetical protein